MIHLYHPHPSTTVTACTQLSINRFKRPLPLIPEHSPTRTLNSQEALPWISSLCPSDTWQPQWEDLSSFWFLAVSWPYHQTWTKHRESEPLPHLIKLCTWNIGLISTWTLFILPPCHWKPSVPWSPSKNLFDPYHYHLLTHSLYHRLKPWKQPKNGWIRRQTDKKTTGLGVCALSPTCYRFWWSSH